MKKILSIAALSLLSLSSLLTAPAQAAAAGLTATGTFNVGLTLTSKCEINTPTDLAMVYTSLSLIHI